VRSDEEGRRKGGVWCREVVELTSLIISIRHNYMQCVTRASLNKVGQNLRTKHFLASLHVCDTIEGLMSIYYDRRFEDFLHLQMLLALPYLIFKSRSAI
jgi:hypothetical protein